MCLAVFSSLRQMRLTRKLSCRDSWMLHYHAPSERDVFTSKCKQGLKLWKKPWLISARGVGLAALGAPRPWFGCSRAWEQGEARPGSTETRVGVVPLPAGSQHQEPATSHAGLLPNGPCFGWGSPEEAVAHGRELAAPGCAGGSGQCRCGAGEPSAVPGALAARCWDTVAGPGGEVRGLLNWLRDITRVSIEQRYI